MAQPAAQPAAKPVAAPAAKPVAQPVAQPAAKPVAQPAAQPAAKPVAQRAAKPVATGGETGGTTGGTTGSETGGTTGAKPVAAPAAQPAAKPVAMARNRWRNRWHRRWRRWPTIDSCTHIWGAPVWAWAIITALQRQTFKCTREGCNERKTLPATVTTSNEYSNCYVYTRYTARVTGPDRKDYFDSKTTNCRRPDWYHDPATTTTPAAIGAAATYAPVTAIAYPAGIPRRPFRVGGYNCLATPKTGDVSVIGMALISLAGAGAAIMGKKRK